LRGWDHRLIVRSAFSVGPTQAQPQGLYGAPAPGVHFSPIRGR
jgi:hypothetical protein